MKGTIFKERVLIFSGNTDVISAVTSITINIINGFSEKGMTPYLFYVNHFIGFERKPTILDSNHVIDVDYFVDNYTVRDFFVLEGFFNTFPFILKKIVSRVLRLLFGHSLLEEITIRNRLKKVIKKENISRIYLINHSYHTRERCLFRFKRFCSDIRCIWVELASRENNYFFKNVNRFFTKNYIRHCDFPFFEKRIENDKIEVVEFPLFGKHIGKSGNIINTTKKACYFGGLIKNVRDPFLLIDLAKNINNIKIDFYTNKSNFQKIVGSLKLPVNVCVHDLVEYDKYKELLFSYDILINIENSNYNSHPSKLYSYISTGLPILSIGKPEDYLHNLLKEHYESYCFVNKNDDIVNNLEIARTFLNSLKITSKNDIDEYFFEIKNTYIISKLLG